MMHFMKPINDKIICKDGESISVQGSDTHYCTPRDDYGPYSHYEVGYPSVRPPNSMMKYAEEPKSPTSTVYGYVPKRIVQEFIDEHGGIESGDWPDILTDVDVPTVDVETALAEAGLIE